VGRGEEVEVKRRRCTGGGEEEEVKRWR